MDLHGLTIFIPTINRATYLTRYLRYLHDQEYCGQLLIGDSSSHEQQTLLGEAVEQFGESFQIKHIDCAGLDVIDTCRLLMAHVATPYMAFCGDDDFLVPSALARCIEYLDAYPDYSGAGGRMVQFATEGHEASEDEAYGSVTYFNEYPMPSLEGQTAQDRLVEYFSCYPVITFAVYRSAVRKPFFELPDFPRKDLSILNEISLNVRSVIAGKFKSLPFLYVLRQLGSQHLTNPNYSEEVKPKTSFDWMFSDGFRECSSWLIDQASIELADTDEIPLRQAQVFFKDEFQKYCGRHLLHPMFWPEPEFLSWHSDFTELRQFYRSVSGALDRTYPLTAKESLGDIHPIFHNPRIARDVDCYSIGNVFADIEQFAALRTLVRMGWNVSAVHDWRYHFCMTHGVEPERLRQFSTSMFDERHYLSSHDVTLEPGETPFQHFMLKGWRLGYGPNPLFDTAWYLEQHPDAAEPDTNPLLHYLNNSYRGVQPHPCFDPLYYLAAHPDVLACGMDPYQHFLSYGAGEGRKAVPDPVSHEYGRWLKRSRIVVCFSEQENETVRRHGRHLEVLLCGALLCVEEGTPLSLPLVPMVEFVPFRSGQDLAEKVVYLLSHQAELDVIAARGQAAAERECNQTPSCIAITPKG